MAGKMEGATMLPSAYKSSNLTKGNVIEERDGVKVTFIGAGNFEIEIDGIDEVETKRGAKAAFKRAESIRSSLDPDYAGPPADDKADATADENSARVKKAKPSKPKTKVKKGKEPSGDKDVMIGSVEAVQRMVPIAVLEELLANQASRVALLRGSDKTLRLQKRVGATDGRCAPIFLTKVNIDDPDEEPKLFDGLITLGAALNLDLKQVAVVILPSAKARMCQNAVVAMTDANLDAPEMAEGDELFYRAGR